MSVLDKKKKVFGNIAALRTLTEDFPKLKTGSSMPSINNSGDAIAFLTDLIKSLVGYEALVESVVDTLVYALKDIETEIKKALKDELKSIVSCGVNPSLPDFIKSTSNGISFTVDKVDFSHLMKVNPLSSVGNLLYNDITTNLLNSTDFNTFLYQTIQNDGSYESWGQNTLGHPILDIKFDSNDITHTHPNNSLTVRANVGYNNKKLTDLNNDFIDSVNLFNTEHIIHNIIDIIFGSISSSIGKSVKQLQDDAKLNTVVDKMIKSNGEPVSDKAFEFTNSELQTHENDAIMRKKGIKELDAENKVNSSVSINNLQQFSADLTGTTTTEQKKLVVKDSLNRMANESAVNSPNVVNQSTIKLNFIQQIINNLIRAIINIVLSPKVVTIFMINFKIIYGPTAEYSDAIDFIKKNKTLFNNLMRRVAGVIIKKLLVLALKTIAKLVAENAIKKEIEKAKSTQAQILSLVGIPQEQLRLLKGL